MIPSQDSEKALRRLFRRKTVADLHDLMKTLETSSRMTVFRRLKPLGYQSSFTDAGKYYTLVDIPVFDDFGLWFYREIGFSRAGTLKATILKIVESSKAGMAPKELLWLLKLKMPNSLHNALRELARSGLLQRQIVDGVHLYTNQHADRVEEQIQMRRLKIKQDGLTPAEPSLETTIAVLVEAIRAGTTLASPKTVSSRLTANGMPVPIDQVVLIYRRHGLNAEKKTMEQPF
ncbi:MAG: hypothetical protein HOE30_03325 [Deltaproteobacteria bacterium]|nr:hypothetical protein [Deltaproteobacteria bacterium]